METNSNIDLETRILDATNKLCFVLTLFDTAVFPFSEEAVCSLISRIMVEHDISVGNSFLFQAEYVAFSTFRTHRSDPEDAHPGCKVRDDLVSEDVLRYWHQRALVTQNDVLQARYADLCWDLWPRMLKKRPPVSFAKTVISSYIAQALRGSCRFQVEAIDKTKTALSIAISIGDESYTESAINAMIQLETAIADDTHVGLWGFCFDALINKKKIALAGEREREIVLALEQRLSRCVEPGNAVEGNDLVAMAAGRRLIDYYQKRADRTAVLRVVMTIANAYCSRRVTDYANRYYRVKRAYELLRLHGLRDEAEKLVSELTELGLESRKNMQTFEYEIEIPTDELNNFVVQFTDAPLNVVLDCVAYHYTPKLNDIRESLKQSYEVAPLTMTMSMDVMDNDGRVVCVVGSLEHDPEGREIHQMAAYHLTMPNHSLDRVLTELQNKGELSVDSFIDYLTCSPAFSEHSLKLLRIGLDAFFREQFIEAAHLITPQLEAAARRTLQLTGADIYKPKNGALYLILLDEVLRHDNLKELFGEDAVTYMRAVLTDQRGLNLRNNICHGMCRPEQLDRRTANRLLHILMIFAGIREGDPVSEESEPN